MDALTIPLTAMAALFPYFLAALALLYLGKFLFDLSTPGIDDNKELAERSNPAFGVFFVGYMLGLAFALAGAFSRLGPSILENFIDIGISGLSAIILLRVSMFIGEKFVLAKFEIDKEIVTDRNLGAGFAFAGLFVASGLIIGAVMTGRSDSWLGMLRDILVYWALGQAFLVVSWLFFLAAARYDVHRVIGSENNAAAGLSLGGLFVAMGIILQAALKGAGSDLGAELLLTLVVGIVGLVLLAAARVLTTLVLLPRVKLAVEVAQKGNLAAGAVSALSYVAVAILYAALVGSQLG